MKLAFRILAPVLVITGAVWLAKYFISTKPEPRKMVMPQQITKVEATRLKPETYQVFVKTQGTVRPRTTSVIIPEVSGRVIFVSPSFREGGYFEEGEVLLAIDPVNYETALVIAESSVAQAFRTLEEAKVSSKQAIENWQRVGKTTEPSDLVKKIPQLREAEARLRAAEAELGKAKRDLERTKIKAPFAGRIAEQIVDIGQYVSPNTQLGRAFATDVMEVRLPLTNTELAFVDLPETYRGESQAKIRREIHKAPEVSISGTIGNHLGRWDGKIVRVDSSIDEMSRQLFVIAEVSDPYRYEEADDSPPLKIGMFVDALVKGNDLENVFILPRQAVRIGGEVIVIQGDNTIRRQKVTPIFSEDKRIVIPAEGGGLKAGEVVCLTPLAYPANGAKVLPTIDGVTPDVEIRGEMFGGKGGKGKGGKGGKGGKDSTEKGPGAAKPTETAHRL
ncbi:MAG: hypothetical protein CMO61_03780 [Verrucomicrobiales bacterium]|nr:hypothetical protein [Verrucomicrobiales bacterium]|tara:strand:- start:5880 stop:7220 length:1341 start_codon:yes stop_codon:yes gene_type:complete